jgi:hypothetical protein
MATGTPSLHHALRLLVQLKPPRSTVPAWSPAIWPGTAITGVGGVVGGVVAGEAAGVGDRPAGTGVGDSDGVVAAGAGDSVGDGVGDLAGPPGLHSGHGHPTGTIRGCMPLMSRRLTSSIPIQDKKASIGLHIHAIDAAIERDSHAQRDMSAPPITPFNTLSPSVPFWATKKARPRGRAFRISTLYFQNSK